MIIEPHYYPSVTFFALGYYCDEWLIDLSGRYQKQTWRNRALILGPNSPQNLIVPIKHTGGIPFTLNQAQIDFSVKWNAQHRNAIKTAYGKAPWFEIYHQQILQPLQKPSASLAELLVETLTVCQKALGLRKTITLLEGTNTPLRENVKDFRNFLQVDSMPGWPISLTWRQVFEKPFLQHTSAIDLIFNEGPAAKSIISELASYLHH